MKTSYQALPAFITKDGSTVREFMHAAQHAALGVRNQSMAEAIVEPGATTLLHHHKTAEEIYHITAGSGRMVLGDKTFDIAVGDTVLIMPGTPHCVTNTGNDQLKILCACSPAYADADTVLL